MNILTVDTSSAQGSIALINKSTSQVVHCEWIKQSSHSELITSMLTSLLNDSHVRLESITDLIVGVGPGSFTGIRVGINLIRALSYSNSLPVYSVNSMRLLAEPALQAQNLPVLCLLNAFKNMLYVAGYSKSAVGVKTWLEPCALPPSALENIINNEVLVVGDGYALYEKFFSARFNAFVRLNQSLSIYPQSQNLWTIVQSSPGQFSPNSWKTVKPLYIRSSEAEEKLRSGLLKPPQRL